MKKGGTPKYTKPDKSGHSRMKKSSGILGMIRGKLREAKKRAKRL
jgi:hypothetical protein